MEDIFIMLKALLMKVKKLIILKVILMECNITHIWLKTKKILYEKSHLSAWWKGINSPNLCTQLYIFSLPPIAPIFPLQSWSHHWRTHNIILYRWTHFIMLLKCHKSTAILRLELQTVNSGDSRNFIQGVPISLWKNFESFWSISGHFNKYWLKFKSTINSSNMGI